MPEMPISCNAVFTSSSLNGLMIASIFFIAYPSQRGLRAPCASQEPCQGRQVRGLKDNARFEHPARLGFAVPGLAERGAGGRAEGANHRCVAAQEVDTILPGRGHGK